METALRLVSPDHIDKYILHHRASNIVFEESRYRVVAAIARQLELLDAVLRIAGEQAALDPLAGVDRLGGAARDLEGLERTAPIDPQRVTLRIERIDQD